MFSHEVGELALSLNGPSNKWLKHIFLHISFYTQAVEQLNFKTKNLKDLLTDEPFTRKDIITIQVG